MFLNYKIDQGLVTTARLLEIIPIPAGTLDYWKWEWKKDGHNTYDMGLRKIGKKAYWNLVQFVNWMAQFKLTNKPTDQMQKVEQDKLIAFVTRNVELKRTINK